MNTNVLRKGDVVSFLYPSTTTNKETLRLVYVDDVYDDKIGCHDYTAEGYRNFKVEKIRQPHLFGTVNTIDDVEVETYDEDDLLQKYLNVQPCEDNNEIHEGVRNVLVDILLTTDPEAKWDGDLGGKYYKVKVKNQVQLQYQSLENVFAKFFEALGV